MSTVDEILATGRYTDRRGREWKKCPPDCYLNGGWVSLAAMYTATRRTEWHPFENEMRMLIEREQHRDECRGLRHCGTHPVPTVVSWTTPIGFPQYGAHWRGRHQYTSTLPEAMDAARALAVGQ